MKEQYKSLKKSSHNANLLANPWLHTVRIYEACIILAVTAVETGELSFKARNYYEILMALKTLH